MVVKVWCSYVLLLAVSANTHMSPSFTTNVFLKTWTINDHLPNFVVSPYSLVAPLGTLALASEGETQKQILDAFSFQTTDQVVGMYLMCKQHLVDVNDVVMKSSSRLYISHRVELLPEFNEAAQHVYDVAVKSEDFANSAIITKKINDWVAKETENRIKTLIDPSTLTPATLAVLVNTLYFDGKWEQRFQEIIKANFYADTSTVIVPTMRVTTKLGYGYIRELEAEVVDIPYKDEQCSFVIILPKNNTKIDYLKNKLQSDENFINNVLDKLSKIFIQLSMPVFEFETETNLKDLLGKLNITDIFSPKAKLTRLMKHDTQLLYIDSAVQKAYIKVNEEGTQAAAANAFAVHLKNFMISDPVLKVEVNRPFYFEIRCSPITLFNGIVRKP